MIPVPSYPTLDYHKSFFEHAAYGIVLYDPQEQRVIECNRKARHLLLSDHCPEAEGVDLLHLSSEYQRKGELSRELLPKIIQQIIDQGECEFQWLFQKPQQRPTLTHIHGFLIDDEQQFAIGLNIKDISESHQRLDSFQHIFKDSDLANSRESLDILVSSLAWEFELDCVVFARCTDEKLDEPEIISAFLGQQIVADFPFDLRNGPCREVHQNQDTIIYNGNLQTAYPEQPEGLAADSYLGVPIFNPSGEIVAYLSTMKSGRFQQLSQLIMIIEKYAPWACMQIERREYDQQVQEKNQRLQRYIDSNLQLENFRYLASHDLKEPLRNLISFSQLLQLKAQHKLDENELEYLSYITNAGKCIESMVNDLLLYSQIDSRQPQPRSCSVQEIIDGALRKMEERHPGRHFQVVREELPSRITGDPKKLQLLFYNLISNACKFVHPDTMPKINICCEEDNGMFHFSVSDNGVGIEEEFHDRVFLLFKKLHNRQGTTGNGVGLSICKKIVVQHQGEIWIDSIPGFGSTFHFTIPVAEADREAFHFSWSLQRNDKRSMRLPAVS